MNTIEKIDQWTEKHRYLWMDIFRIALGCILMVKGIEFGSHPNDVKLAISQTPFDFLSFVLVHYIIMVHIFGGLMIALGLVTRLAVAFQLPILLGAVIFMPDTSMFSFYSTIALAWVVLLSLLVFLVYGSGNFSVDRYLQRHPDANYEH
jgi:putative oxidoreductase